MTNFEWVLEQQVANAVAAEEAETNLVRNGDFATHRLSDSRAWGTMRDTGDGSWYAVSGKFEVQRAKGHGGTPAKKTKTAVLELDSHTGAKHHGATNSNAVVSQVIEEITGPGTFRLSLDYSARKMRGIENAETSTAEVWLGDIFVATLTNTHAQWEEKIFEVTLDEENMPAGPMELRLVATGRADGYGALIDNVSLREIGETGLLSEELVTNGSFETSPNFGRWKTFEGIEGWSVSDDSVIELQHVRKPATPRDPSDTYIELDGHGKDSNAELAQDIEVTEAGLYLLAFDYSPRGHGAKAAQTSSMEVWIGATVVAEISADTVGWKPYTFNVNLAEGPITLSFKGTGQQDTRGALLDNVKLVRVGDTPPGEDPMNPNPDGAWHNGLWGEVFFANEALRTVDQAIGHIDETPDATFVATAIDYGNQTGWFHTPLDMVLEHDAVSLNDGADLTKNVNHTVINLTGEIFLEQGTHHFYNRTDDGFRLTIDAQEIAEYEGIRAAKTTKGSITVDADGWYSINVDYFDWQGHSKLRIEHQQQGEARGILSADRLRHGYEDPEIPAEGPADGWNKGLWGQVFFADEVLRTIDQAISHMDATPDATFVATAIDYGNYTGWFHTPIDAVLEHDARSLNEDADLSTNVNNTYINLTGEIYLEAGKHTFYNRTDDGFRLRIDGQEIAEFEGLRAPRVTKGTITVEADGWYEINVDYFDWKGGSKLRILHQQEGGTREVLSDDRLRYRLEDQNTAPEAADDAATMDEDTAISLDLLANDHDADGDALSIVGLGPVDNGALTDNGDGTVTFTPAGNFHGVVVFDYTLSDGAAETTATARITVTPVNDAPVAALDQAETAEDTVITLDLLANDFDVDGDTLSIDGFGPVDNAVLTDNGDGSVTLLPATDFHGEITFDYTVTDGDLSSTATATVIVTPVNDAPLARNDVSSTQEDMAVVIDLLGNDLDVDGDALRISDLGAVQGGTLTDNGDGTVTFTPDAGFVGDVSFDYTITDGDLRATATARITVIDTNARPVAHDDDFRTEESVAITMDLLANDMDPDGDSFAIVGLGPVNGGTLQLEANGTVTFTPAMDFIGDAAFDYVISDGAVTDTATVTIEVASTNIGPVAQDDTVTVDEDSHVVLDILTNDTDPDGVVVTLVGLPTSPHGVFTYNVDGTLTFTPDADYNGEVTVSYSIQDADGARDTGTVTITVDPVNDAPETRDDAQSVIRGSSILANVLANDREIDKDDELSLVSATTDRGSVSIVNNKVLFEPGPDFDDLDLGSSVDQVITYTVRDLVGATSTGTLTVTVSAPFQNPVNETLTFREIGRNGTNNSPDGQEGEQNVIDAALIGDDNLDRLKIDMLSRGGKGRDGANGDRGDADDYTGGDGTAGAPGGLAAQAVAELVNASIDGRESADLIDVSVVAEGGDGGAGGDGGHGGRADKLGTHRVILPGVADTTYTYGNGVGTTGGDGAVAGDGANGGDATARMQGGAFDGGDGADNVTIIAEATAGHGGDGGVGGAAGTGGNDGPLGGAGTNISHAGDSGAGGVAGDALAEILGVTATGGEGDDAVTLGARAEGGAGGEGGNGRTAAVNSWQDTTFMNYGSAELNTYDGEIHYVHGTAGDGGASGDSGAATARLDGNTVDGGIGDDVLTLEAIAVAAGSSAGGNAGNGGVDTVISGTLSGTYDLHYTAGTAGTAGADGQAGTALAQITNNVVTGDLGDDVLQIVLQAEADDAATLVLTGNTLDGGDGTDTLDLAGVGHGVEVDLGAGTFGLTGASGANTVMGVEGVLTGDGDDSVTGSGAADVLDAGAGNDVLNGNGGRDTFVFNNGNGQDVIGDFSADVIDLAQVSGARSFAGLDIADTGDGALITLSGTDTILLDGVQASTLSDANFVF